MKSVFSINDPLYVIKEKTKAIAMWLATPAISSTGNLNYIEERIFITVVFCMVAFFRVITLAYGVGAGFRPIVCLKSNVELEESESGYIIK